MKSTTRILVSTFGTLVGLAGLEHGVGEILQGNTTPEGIMILSWPNSEFFQVVSGEPAMTIVPNLLVTGILAVLFSILFIVWSIWGIHRKQGGWIMILLSIALLLFGGGLFPPVLGIIIALIGMKINTPLLWWRAHLSPAARSTFRTIWPWTFAAGLAAWLGMIPGLPVLAYFFGLESEALTWVLLACMFTFLFLSTLASLARDSHDLVTPH